MRKVTVQYTTADGSARAGADYTPANNPLQEIRLGALQNAAVTVNGQPVTSGQRVSLPPNTVAADMQVRRVTAGQPTTVPFTVVDSCGEWTTFVGGGASAGF